METRHVAFVGGVEMAVPKLTGENGFCPALEPVVGVVKGAARWQTFVSAGSRTAREFVGAWGALRLEVSGLSVMLGKELAGSLSSPVESAGTDGSRSSRRSITEQREELRHEAMLKCLEGL